MTRKQRRLALIGSALAVLAVAVALVLNAMRDSIAKEPLPSAAAAAYAAVLPSVVRVVGERAKPAEAASAPKSVARVQVATVAPFRFGTVGYNQWWAKALMASRFGWTSPAQFQCLVTLWNRESHWNYKAHNGGSGAHGIPQALPGSKMRSAGSDWRTNPVTQILWGLGYVERRYSTPCGALSHFRSLGWY